MIPSALKHVQEIARRTDRPAIFLDYDGTLTPIVSHPENALLSDSMQQALQELVLQAPVAILSGRDLDDVRQRVNMTQTASGQLEASARERVKLWEDAEASILSGACQGCLGASATAAGAAEELEGAEEAPGTAVDQ